MLDIQINGSQITFSESGKYFNSGYKVDLKKLSLNELQNLRSLTLKVYYDKIKESCKQGE